MTMHDPVTEFDTQINAVTNPMAEFDPDVMRPYVPPFREHYDLHRSLVLYMKMKGHPRLAQERIKRGWSQAQVARRLSVDSSAVARWEDGSTAPRMKTLIKLQELFGISWDELFEDHPVMKEAA